MALELVVFVFLVCFELFTFYRKVVLHNKLNFSSSRRAEGNLLHHKLATKSRPSTFDLFRRRCLLVVVVVVVVVAVVVVVVVVVVVALVVVFLRLEATPLLPFGIQFRAAQVPQGPL